MGPYLLRESSSRGLTTVIEAAEKSMTDISFPDSQYANTNEVCEKNNDQQDAASSRRHLTDFIKGKEKRQLRLHHHKIRLSDSFFLMFMGNAGVLGLHKHFSSDFSRQFTNLNKI